jgi:hypothetical protein
MNYFFEYVFCIFVGLLGCVAVGVILNWAFPIVVRCT